MRKVEQTIYSINELEGRARKVAFQWARGQMYETEAEEVNNAVSALESHLNNYSRISVKDLNVAADKIGDCYAYDIVDAYIEQTGMHGEREADRVLEGLNKVADKMADRFYVYDEECFPDDDVIATADANDWEFTERGELYRA